MSLILEALRRADAERERGAVPGLHTPQPMPPVAPGPARGRAPAVVAALVVCAAVAGGGAVWWQLRSPAGSAPSVAPVAAPLPAPAPAPAVIAAPVVAVPAPAPVPLPAPAPAPVAVAETPPPARKTEAPVVAAKPAMPARAALPPPVQAPTPEPAPPAPVAPPRPPLLLELAPATRQQLPQLTVSGASYSADPAFRMVIVNGQVTHEGDSVGNGVVLESIAPRQVVLRGMGQRWAVPY